MPPKTMPACSVRADNKQIIVLNGVMNTAHNTFLTSRNKKSHSCIFWGACHKIIPYIAKYFIQIKVVILILHMRVCFVEQVLVPKDESLLGKVVEVVITSAGKHYLKCNVLHDVQPSNVPKGQISGLQDTPLVRGFMYFVCLMLFICNYQNINYKEVSSAITLM